MNHWGSHKLHFFDQEYTCTSNSLHHQLQYPYPISKDEYKILAYTYGLSDYYHGSGYSEMDMPETTKLGNIKEPEFVYYSKIKGLGIQGHPEMMDRDSDMVIVCRAFLDLLISKKLDDVLKLELSVANIIERAWNFRFTAEEAMRLKELVPKKKLALV